MTSIREAVKHVSENRSISRSWRVTWQFIRLNIRSQMEYRVNFFMSIAIGAVWQVSIVVFAVVLLTRFPGMGNWTSSEVLLIVGMRMLSHGLYVLFFGRIFELSSLVQEGRIDTFLLRPLPVYRQVQLAFFPANAVGDLAVALCLFVDSLIRSSIEWSPGRITFLVAAILSGMLLEAAMFTALSSIALHFPTTSYWSTWLDELMGTFGSYPLSILPRAAEAVFTFGIPLAFIAYLPAGVLSGRSATLGVPESLAILSPLAGPTAFIATRLLWNHSLRRYPGMNS